MLHCIDNSYTFIRPPIAPKGSPRVKSAPADIVLFLCFTLSGFNACATFSFILLYTFYQFPYFRYYYLGLILVHFMATFN